MKYLKAKANTAANPVLRIPAKKAGDVFQHPNAEEIASREKHFVLVEIAEVKETKQSSKK